MPRQRFPLLTGLFSIRLYTRLALLFHSCSLVFRLVSSSLYPHYHFTVSLRSPSRSLLPFVLPLTEICCNEVSFLREKLVSRSSSRNILFRMTILLEGFNLRFVCILFFLFLSASFVFVFDSLMDRSKSTWRRKGDQQRELRVLRHVAAIYWLELVWWVVKSVRRYTVYMVRARK